MTRFFSSPVFAVLIAILGSGSFQASLAQSNRTVIISKAARRIAEKNEFIGSLLVAEADTVLVDASFGFADLNSHVTNTPDSQFRIGSLTKPFTASLVLLLQQDGKIQLEDHVSKYLPYSPPAWRSITISNLLAHTSGIPDFTDDAGFVTWAVTPHSHREEIDLFRGKPLKFRPGTRFDYSNSNYILLGAVIEGVTKQHYERELRSRILDPLQMYDSGLDADGLTLPRRVLGYRLSHGVLVQARSESMSIPWAAGGMYTTTHDLLKSVRALFKGELLSAASLQAMTTARKGAYGLGIGVGFKHGTRAVWHDGGIEGFNSYLTYLPERQIAVIVLANQDGDSADRLASQLLDLALTN